MRRLIWARVGCILVMEFCHLVMEKSLKSHGILSRTFRGNPVLDICGIRQLLKRSPLHNKTIFVEFRNCK